MFFTLHSEHKIGYKKLSEADLGLTEGSSHQTHIGLYERKNMLSFLKNEDTTTAILIYNDYFDVLQCNFERIQNPDGTYRSPKISLGEKDENTVVRKIREFAKLNPKRDYYLVWFALENNELLFWLIDNSSSDYAKLKDFFPTENTVYDTSEIMFAPLIKFIESKIDELSIGLQEDLEIASQTSAKSGKYRTLDIEKAQERFKITGRTGEELINEYLEMQKSEKLICSFEWVNKSSGKGETELLVEKGGEIKSYKYLYWFPFTPYTEVFPKLFPWANFDADEDFYEDNDEALWRELNCYYDEEDHDWCIVGDSYDEFRKKLNPMRSIDHCGEVAEYMLVLSLNELGRSFLEVDKYVSQTCPYSSTRPKDE